MAVDLPKWGSASILSRRDEGTIHSCSAVPSKGTANFDPDSDLFDGVPIR